MNAEIENMEEEFDRVCRNCGSFFIGEDNLYSDFGVCLNDEVFEPFIDEIFESDSISCCYDLYQEKKFNGLEKVCEDFEPPEYLDVPEGMDPMEFACIVVRHEAKKTQDLDGFKEYLYGCDKDIQRKAVGVLSEYLYIGNEGAYRILWDYYNSLGPADTLDEVHFRVEVVDLLCRDGKEEQAIEVYINELLRTQSNNTTRQLYTAILDKLERYPAELTKDPLERLLNKSILPPK